MFRDKWLRIQTDGEALIPKYYCGADIEGVVHDAIDELIDKLMQVDPLLEQYNRAEADGDEVGVRRLKKQMEGLSKKIEKLDLDTQ